MRLDRLITLGVVRPFRAAWPPARPRPSIPILMYHSVSDDPEPGVSAYYRTAVSPRRFGEQMRFLHAHGWRGVGLREGIALGEGARGGDVVILTFDDGFRDFATAALPILQGFGFRATVFLPTAFIAGEGPPRQFRGRDCLTWAEAAQIGRAGIELGSHTVHHPELASLPWPEAESEITLSRSEIQRRLGLPVTSFSQPFAFPQADAPFCSRLRASLVRVGYEACVTTEIGRAATGADPFRLKRLPVNEADDIPLFAAKLAGSYDWLGLPQRASKAFRSRRPALETATP